MIVPFSVTDFLDRALAVYARPDRRRRRARPAGASLGDAQLRPTWASWPARWRPAWTSSASGVGERVAFVSHNSARLLAAFFGVCGYGRVLVPINFRLSAEEVRLHRRALRGAGALRRPRARGALADVTCEHMFVLGEDDDLFRPRVPSRSPGSPTRTPPRRSTTPPARRPGPRACRSPTATSGPTRSPSRCTPASPTATSTCTRCRCSTPTAGGCRSAMTGMGVPAGRAAQGRRRRDPAPGGQVRRDRDVCRACGRQRRARRGGDLGGRDPRPGPGPDHRRRRAAADQDDRAGPGGARLGVHPDLRPDRDLAAAHRQPDRGPSGTTCPPRSARRSSCAPARRPSASP